MRSLGPTGGEFLSKRRATLETIRGKGEPVMESRLVVDHTEIDANGFLTGRASEDSHPVHELWAQARSLDSRANSRDGEQQSRLRAESRELRDQAQGLRKRLATLKPA
jgi:hypothetical protein